VSPGQATRLFPSLISAGYSFRPQRWWRRAPFLPIPDAIYTRWRLQTAYGRTAGLPPLDDIAAFAAWRRDVRRLVEMESK
jgi:hypothetical protein